MNLYKILIHSHRLIVTIYVLVFLVKVGYLLFASRSKFQTLRARTKLFEMIFGSLVLVSGLWLYFGYGWIDSPEYWIHLKLGLVLVGIVLGMIALKRSNKRLAIFTAALFIFIYLLGHSKGALLSTHASLAPAPCPVAGTAVLDTEGTILLGIQDCARFHGSSPALASVEQEHLLQWAHELKRGN